MKKKLYTKPEIVRMALDNIISLQMTSYQPQNPGIRGAVSGSDNNTPSAPFASPFADKPFQ